MAEPRSLHRGRLVVLELLAAALLVTGCGGSRPQGTATGDENHGYRGIYLDQPYRVPPIALTSDEGRPTTLSKQPGLTLVFFGYTRCPDVCQTVMSTIASAVIRLPPADRDQVTVDFVTTDPARDTETVLHHYLARFDPDFRGLTGPLPRITALGEPLGLSTEKAPRLPSGGYEVSHSANITAVHHGQGLVVWTPATSPADLTADLTRLLREVKR